MIGEALRLGRHEVDGAVVGRVAGLNPLMIGEALRLRGQVRDKGAGGYERVSIP